MAEDGVRLAPYTDNRRRYDVHSVRLGRRIGVVTRYARRPWAFYPLDGYQELTAAELRAIAAELERLEAQS